MDHSEVQRRCEAFLQSLGSPGFIVFGWQESPEKFTCISSYHEIPAQTAVKGMVWALHELTNKAL
jgi:hypothetical protein